MIEKLATSAIHQRGSGSPEDNHDLPRLTKMLQSIAKSV
jgi:hypothetical protein